MTDERWHELLVRIEKMFEILENDSEDIKDDDMPFGCVEWVVFEGKVGRIRLERTVTSRVIDKKVLHSHRGGSAMVQKVYSQTERISELRAYRWNDRQETWDEMNTEDFV